MPGYVIDNIAEKITAMGAVRTNGSAAIISDTRNTPLLGVPGLAFWGGVTLVTAVYDAGRNSGG